MIPLLLDELIHIGKIIDPVSIQVLFRGRSIDHQVDNQITQGPLIMLAWYIRQGYTNEQIAEILYVSVHTVKSRAHKLLVKFNVRSRYVLREALELSDFDS